MREWLATHPIMQILSNTECRIEAPTALLTSRPPVNLLHDIYLTLPYLTKGDAKGFYMGHFTHETESPWPLHFKHSRWWKRRRSHQSKFASSHYAWGTNGGCECKVGVRSTWVLTLPYQMGGDSIRATSHTRLGARDHYISSTLIGGKGSGATGPSSLLHTMFEGPTDWGCECKVGLRFTWVPWWHRMVHLAWSLGWFFINHLLEVGRTQNRETVALRMLTTIDLFYLIMCEDPRE